MSGTKVQIVWERTNPAAVPDTEGPFCDRQCGLYLHEIGCALGFDYDKRYIAVENLAVETFDSAPGVDCPGEGEYIIDIRLKELD